MAQVELVATLRNLSTRRPLCYSWPVGGSPFLCIANFLQYFTRYKHEASEIFSSTREVVFRHEHDDSVEHDPFASNARRPLHVAERSECYDGRFDYFQGAKLAKPRKAVCEEIEKETKVNGISLKTLRRRLVRSYSNSHYSLM